MKKKNEGYIIGLVLVIIALLVIGAGIYLNNKTASDVPNISDEQKDVSVPVKSATNIVTEQAIGIVKSVYNQSGKNYIDIDYVELNTKWAPGGMNGPVYQNVNSKIRTFEISSNAKFMSGSPATNSITFSTFQNYFNTSNTTYQKNNPWDIVVINGVVTKIEEHFIP